MVASAVSRCAALTVEVMVVVSAVKVKSYVADTAFGEINPCRGLFTPINSNLAA